MHSSSLCDQHKQCENRLTKRNLIGSIFGQYVLWDFDYFVEFCATPLQVLQSGREDPQRCPRLSEGLRSGLVRLRTLQRAQVNGQWSWRFSYPFIPPCFFQVCRPIGLITKSLHWVPTFDDDRTRTENGQHSLKIKQVSRKGNEGRGLSSEQRKRGSGNPGEDEVQEDEDFQTAAARQKVR